MVLEQVLVWCALYYVIWFFFIKECENDGMKYGVGIVLLGINAFLGFTIIGDTWLTWIVLITTLIYCLNEWGKIWGNNFEE